MFNEILIKKFMKITKIESMEAAEIALKNQAKYTKINAHLLLKSYAVLERVLNEQEAQNATLLKAQSKNIYIQKYKSEIIDLYVNQNFGYLKISNAMKINHNVKVSKSAIENFIKKNNIERENG